MCQSGNKISDESVAICIIFLHIAETWHHNFHIAETWHHNFRTLDRPKVLQEVQRMRFEVRHDKILVN